MTCRLIARFRDTSRRIGVELRMPARNWNGKFVEFGCGGYRGRVRGSHRFIARARKPTYAECYLPARPTTDLDLVSLLPPIDGQRQPVGHRLATQLADHLRGLRLRNSYRFLFIPGTIGSITWLAHNEERIPHIKAGLVAACVGDPGHPPTSAAVKGTPSSTEQRPTSWSTPGDRIGSLTSHRTVTTSASTAPPASISPSDLEQDPA